MNMAVTPEELFLDLMKRCLTRTLFPDGSIVPGYTPTPGEFSLEKRSEGLDWPSDAETMIGLRRLDNVQECVVDILNRGIPGDLVEAGVWRGGAAILMRAVLAAYGDRTRCVWLADSFRGLPQPDDEHYPADAGDRHWELSAYLGIPLEAVRRNFERYRLLDDQVRFLPGWFKDTLPLAPVTNISVLRLDGDMYESTMEALVALYPKVSAGGYVIIDDYGALPNCKAAVHDFREAHSIRDRIQMIDWTGAYWQKSALPSLPQTPSEQSRAIGG
jgi:O-methyltransferase